MTDDPDIRSIRVEGVGYEEYRRGTVGYYLLSLVEQYTAEHGYVVRDAIRAHLEGVER